MGEPAILKNAYVTLTEIETARHGLDLAQPNPFRLRCGAVDASDVLITSDDARAGHQADGLLQSGGVSGGSAGLPAAWVRCARSAHHGAESCLSGHAVTAIASIAGMMLR